MVRAAIPHIGASPHCLRPVCRRRGTYAAGPHRTHRCFRHPATMPEKAGVEVYRYARQSVDSPVRIRRIPAADNVSTRSWCALWRRFRARSTHTLRSVVFSATGLRYSGRAIHTLFHTTGCERRYRERRRSRLRTCAIRGDQISRCDECNAPVRTVLVTGILLVASAPIFDRTTVPESA